MSGSESQSQTSSSISTGDSMPLNIAANAWSYWITAWAGNAAIAVGWVL